MNNKILIIGGNGLIGKTIGKMLSERNPNLQIFIGTRKKSNSNTEISMDVNDPNTFDNLLKKAFSLIVLCTRDPQNNVLNYAVTHKIDYIDITKPTAELVEAHQSLKHKMLNNKIVFSSGWMGGITPLVLYSTGVLVKSIQKINLFVYYSTKDKAGESSADFMAENVNNPFVMYENNVALKTKHFLDSENYHFLFESVKRRFYNFYIPDLYIFNQIEKIPTVKSKLTFDSKWITNALAIMQKTAFFKLLNYKGRKLIFGGGGKGDSSIFEIVYRTTSEEKKIAVKCEKGQSELTAFSTVLHIEKMLQNSNPNGIYFSHQLHNANEFVHLLTENSSISIKKS